MSKAFTKREIRSYMRRIREDLRDLEAAMTDGDLDEAIAQAYDASAAAVEIASLFEYAQGEAPYGYRPDGTPAPPR